MKFQRIGNRNLYFGVTYEHPDWLTNWNSVITIGFVLCEAEIRWPKLLPDRNPHGK